MIPEIGKDVVELLERAVGGEIENFEVRIQDGNNKGAGFLGVVTFISLKNKKTAEENNLVVKQVRPSATEKTRALMTSSYFNEIQYYTKIFPALLNFQKSYPAVRKFDNFPKCYATSLKGGFENLVLENLKFRNYELHPTADPFDLKSFEKIFKMYAEFHALSFAFKIHQPEEFLEVTRGLNDNWLSMIENPEILDTFLKHFVGKVKGYLEEDGEDKILENFEKYVQDAKTYLKESMKGSTEVLLHGDCWSNNLMFKYNTLREIEHIKMIDFQLGYVGSPVLDLSYSFYAGAGQNVLDNLENLLKGYHKDLSDNLRKYGCDPEKIYPYDVLKKEWRNQCIFGYIVSVLAWGTKTAIDLTEMPTLNEMMDGVSENLGMQINERKYRKLVLDITRHMHENKFL